MEGGAGDGETKGPGVDFYERGDQAEAVTQDAPGRGKSGRSRHRQKSLDL